MPHPEPVDARQLLAAGRSVLSPLPTTDQLAAATEEARIEFLDELRSELYALAAVLAERAVHRAWTQRATFPPYGLAQSRFTQLRAVSDAPAPFEEGAIGDFRALGRAYVDTVVFHLDRALGEVRHSDRAWLIDRLQQLLELFQCAAPAAALSRLRDPFSFLYGGLHFGTSVCVELVEVMNRIIPTSLGAASRAASMTRSIRPAYQLAGVNLDDVPVAYRILHGGGREPGWMDSACFVTEKVAGGQRVDLRPGVIGPVRRSEGGSNAPRYTTRGCPARYPVDTTPGAIATLWTWAVELAVATGLIADR